MKRMLTAFFFVILSHAVLAQSDETMTTFILVRHAEKANDGTNNPDLTEQGRTRAVRLATMFRDTPLSAIYATNFKRTQETVHPLAKIQGLKVQSYEPLKEEVLKEMLDKHRGGTILISGHSNTTPWTANVLLRKQVLKDYSEDEYGIILIITVSGAGRAASITRVNY